jgi:hypothetical protein
MQRQGGPGEDVMRPLQPYIAVSDCDLIERIIANMISNAVKFTSSGAVQPFICPVETYYQMLMVLALRVKVTVVNFLLEVMLSLCCTPAPRRIPSSSSSIPR